MPGGMALTRLDSGGCQDGKSGHCREQGNQEFHDRALGWILSWRRMLRTFYQTDGEFSYSDGFHFFIAPDDFFPAAPGAHYHKKGNPPDCSFRRVSLTPIKSTNCSASSVVAAGIRVAATMAGVPATLARTVAGRSEAATVGARSAAVKGRAPCECGMPVAVVANHHALTVNFPPARTAAAALRTEGTMLLPGFSGGRRENGKSRDERKQGDELFHDFGCGFSLGGAVGCATFSDVSRAWGIQPKIQFYIS